MSKEKWAEPTFFMPSIKTFKSILKLECSRGINFVVILEILNNYGKPTKKQIQYYHNYDDVYVVQCPAEIEHASKG